MPGDGIVILKHEVSWQGAGATRQSRRAGFASLAMTDYDSYGIAIYQQEIAIILNHNHHKNQWTIILDFACCVKEFLYFLNARFAVVFRF